MNFKKVFALFFVLALALMLFACGEKPLEIADENGAEDHSLAVLTLQEICAQNPKYSCRVYGVGIIDDGKSGENGGVYDADKIVGEAGSEFSGVAVLQKTYGKSEKITFAVNCERTKGNMRVVLVDDKLNVIHDFAVGESSVFELENAAG